jgi:hypothetical protein
MGGSIMTNGMTLTDEDIAAGGFEEVYVPQVGGAVSEAGEPVPQGQPSQRQAQRPDARRNMPNPHYRGGETATENFMLPALQGLSLGWSDEALAAVMAAYAQLAPEIAGGLPADDPRGYGELYSGMRDTVRESQDAYAREEGFRSGAAELLGGLATGGAGLWKTGGSALAKGIKARGLRPDMDTAKRVGQNVGVGATEGAIYGAGTAEEMEDVPEESLRGAAWGTAGGAAGGELMHQGRRLYNQRGAIKDEIVKSLERGDVTRDTALVKFEKDWRGKNKLMDHPVALEAKAQGFDEGIIAQVRRSTPVEKASYRKILKTAEDIIQYGAEKPERLWDIVGERFMTRVNTLKRENKKAGKAVGDAANDLKDKYVDFRPAVSKFEKDLDDIGVKLELNEQGQVVPNFVPKVMNPRTGMLEEKRSMIAGVPAAKNLISEIVAQMRQGDNISAYDMHNMKRLIDEMVTWGEGGEGLKGASVRIVKDLRKNIDDILDTNFPDYNDANEAYKNTIRILDDLQQHAGRRVNLNDLEDMEKVLGAKVRTVLSDNATRGTLYNTLKDLDNFQESVYGGRNYDNLLRLSTFAETVENSFPELKRAKPTSATGIGQKTVETAAKSPSQAAADAMVGQVVNLTNEMTGINRRNAIKSMYKLIENQEK